MIEKGIADEKVEHGWLRIFMIFEVLAGKEETASSAINKLIDRLDSDKRVKLYKKKMSEIRNVDNPMKDVAKGYSIDCEAEMVINNFDNAVQIVMEYGPSVVEVLEPSKIQMKLGEAQGALNSVSQMMHKFAAAGIGGIVFVGQKE